MRSPTRHLWSRRGTSLAIMELGRSVTTGETCACTAVMAGALADASSCAAYTDTRVTHAQRHRELARAAQVLALVQGEDGVLGDQAELTGIRTERGGRGASRWVLDDAADGERVTDVE